MKNQWSSTGKPPLRESKDERPYVFKHISSSANGRKRQHGGDNLAIIAGSQAEITREAITRNAGAEIESYKVAFTQARESAAAREKTAQLTQSLFTDNLQRFRLGRASANELAIDQQRLLETEILEVEGWTTVHLSFVRLCHALGRTMRADGSCEPLKRSR